jgi:hypothetical protein
LEQFYLDRTEGTANVKLQTYLYTDPSGVIVKGEWSDEALASQFEAAM